MRLMKTAKKTGMSVRGATALLGKILKQAKATSSLKKRVSKTPKGTAWQVSFKFLSAPAMKRLNFRYRKKNSATDILSFPAPEIFRQHGMLGELVICEAVLLRQAREQEHNPRRELEVLLVHGVLHLLDFDHERGPKAAVEMARWESKLLAGLKPSKETKSGLVARSK